MYIIYVNDLPEVVQSNLWMFADDTKIDHAISSNEDSILLQGDLRSSYYDMMLNMVNDFNSASVHHLVIVRFL